MRDDNPFRELTPKRRHWLWRILVEDWSLKLLALAITLVLWFLVTGRGSN
jgi:hypothetical protein